MKTFSNHRCWYGATSESGLCLYDRQTIRTSPQSVCCGRRHGGHQAGDFASKYTVEVLKRELAQVRRKISRSACFSDQDSQSRDHQKASEDPHLKGMGTTIVVPLL